ncbi:MAG TPA: hypothetical protein VEH07_01035 [Alphaproteobacteria bacterium]|nr:hypothetical protein [Alphaproteobacteria bacterium]
MAAVQGFLQAFIMAILVFAIAMTLGVATPMGRSASQPQQLAPPVASGATTALL